MSILPGGPHPFARENINDGGFSVSASAAIRIDSLTKSFGWRPGKRVQAVEDLSLEVAAGQVYGFLGPNGAGKTTTIRMLLDPIRPDRGDVFLFGQHVRREHTVLRRVGSLVEGSVLLRFPHRTAQPRGARAHLESRPASSAVRRRPRPRRHEGGFPAPGQGLFHGYEATARNRRRHADRPRLGDLG